MKNDNNLCHSVFWLRHFHDNKENRPAICLHWSNLLSRLLPWKMIIFILTRFSQLAPWLIRQNSWFLAHGCKEYFSVLCHRSNFCRRRKICGLKLPNYLETHDTLRRITILVKLIKFLVAFTLRKKCYWIKSMYIMDLNQNAIELVTYLLVLVVYFYELIVCMLLERNTFDSIALFSQCTKIN